MEWQRSYGGMISNTRTDVEWLAVEVAFIDEAHIGIGFDFRFVTIVNHNQADVETASHNLDDALHRIGFGSGHFPNEGVVAVFAGTFGITT